MSLRIRKLAPLAAPDPMAGPAAPVQGDGWASRLVKLIPAEALGLYGAGTPLVHDDRLGQLVLVGACLAFAGTLRWKATQDAQGRPQWLSIAIALVSFILWLAALPPGTSPLSLGAHANIASLVGLVWAAFVTAFHKGD